MLDPPDAAVDDDGAADDEELDGAADDEELEAGVELVAAGAAAELVEELAAAGAAELVGELEFEPHPAKTSAATTVAPASNPRIDLPVIAIYPSPDPLL